MRLDSASGKLSILVPTFNRVEKLGRLLRNIDDELARSGIAGRVDVLVSDNASTDSTPHLLDSSKPANFRLRSFRQAENVGMDRNMQFLYERATSEYIWFFSDDDILLPGSVAKVLEVLDSSSPDVVTCLTRQPSDVLRKPPDFSAPVEILEEPARAVEPLTYWISVYILRRVVLDPKEEKVLEPFLGTDWWFMALACSILQRSPRPRLGLIPEPLAIFENQYRPVRFPPETWAGYWKVYTHPFIAEHAPHLLKEKQKFTYSILIYYLFAVQAELIAVEDRQAYDAAVRNLEFRPAWLLVSPKSLLKFLLLKFTPKIIPAVASWALAVLRWFGLRPAEGH